MECLLETFFEEKNVSYVVSFFIASQFIRLSLPHTDITANFAFRESELMAFHWSTKPYSIIYFSVSTLSIIKNVLN